MEEKSWTVVLFVDDKSVEAVPSTWIQGDFCHWPSFTTEKLSQAIKRCEPLNTCWPSHRIKIFRNATFGDYARARAKTKVAEFQSDLNTDDEESNKRKRIRKVFSSSSESETLSDSGNLPLPPKMKKTYHQDSEINKSAATCDLDETCLNHSQLQLPGKELVMLNETNNLENDNINLNCKECKERDKYLKDRVNDITQQVHIVRGIAVDILSDMKYLKSIIKNNSSAQQERKETFSLKYPDIKFPISSTEEFEHMEEVLEDNKEDLELLAAELAKIGGTNCYNFVKRALSMLLKNEVALKYSWLGRKGKRIFSKLNTAKALIFAAEKANISQTQSEVEVSIQVWLKRATDRRVHALKKSNDV